MTSHLIQGLKNQWRNCNSATTGFAQVIPVGLWNTKPFNPRFKPFSWEFACLVRTRLCRIQAINTGILNFGKQNDIPEKSDLKNMKKVDVISMISETSNSILSEIEKIDKEEKAIHVLWLLQHERIHHGKLILMLSKANLEIPDSFKKTWGEVNFNKPK